MDGNGRVKFFYIAIILVIVGLLSLLLFRIKQKLTYIEPEYHEEIRVHEDVERAEQEAVGVSDIEKIREPEEAKPVYKEKVELQVPAEKMEVREEQEIESTEFVPLGDNYNVPSQEVVPIETTRPTSYEYMPLGDDYLIPEE